MFGNIIALATLLAYVASDPIDLAPRATSSSLQNSCVACAPSGWTTINPPAIGSSDFANMYTDLVNTVQGIHFPRDSGPYPLREYLERRATPPICCAQGTQCLLMQNLNIPMCYDKFTTNFILPDGSYGTIATGAYTSSDGTTANLISGNFTSGSSTGDIYASATSAKPNTATLSIPAQFTGTGVGSAIPASQLGLAYSYLLTTITGPTTLSASTVSGGSTVPPRTITGPTTITISTSTYTTTAGASATATKKSEAPAGRVGAVERILVKAVISLVGVCFAAVIVL